MLEFKAEEVPGCAADAFSDGSAIHQNFLSTIHVQSFISKERLDRHHCLQIVNNLR